MLGAITAPASVRPPQGPRRSLERHPWIVGSAACDICGNLRTMAYAHPNPLRPGVVLYRCFRHTHPKHVVDDPKTAPGGGVYR